MTRHPPRSTLSSSSAASDVYKRQDAIRATSADMSVLDSPPSQAGTLPQLETEIEQERSKLIQLQSQLNTHQQQTEQRCSSLFHDTEAARLKLMTLPAQLANFQVQLDQQNRTNTELQRRRDVAHSQLASLEQAREQWRTEAIERVGELETRHNWLTATRHVLDEETASLEQSSEEEQRLTQAADQGLERARELLEKALVLNQQLVSKLKRLKT
eukprot:TRINITY_DN21725_c0_g1_i1.p1 TRINITY_DN21725_c0_g1~~TRINITY_DN21725_c0_g1_i1.p1  ORF type:complete len:214 (+),score=49.21 TRINITY_DN21725_c0_g1_i1:104-745(+)